jgi:hypothetical protein
MASALIVPGLAFLLPMSIGCPASAISYAAMNSGDQGKPGSGILGKPAAAKIPTRLAVPVNVLLNKARQPYAIVSHGLPSLCIVGKSSVGLPVTTTIFPSRSISAFAIGSPAF